MTQFRINPGILRIISPGNTASLDLQHNGTNSSIISVTGDLHLGLDGTSPNLILSSTALSPSVGGELNLGSLSSYYSTVFAETFSGSDDANVAIKGADGT